MTYPRDVIRPEDYMRLQIFPPSLIRAWGMTLAPGQEPVAEGFNAHNHTRCKLYAVKDCIARPGFRRRPRKAKSDN